MFEENWQSLFEDDLDKLSEIINPVQEKTVKLEEGENRIVSIFFLDIKGFTSMSEKLHPEQVKRTIDRIFKVFSNVILKYGGYISLYEGDKIMALFGSKVTTETDTERSIRSGLEILNKIKYINEMLKPQEIELGIRIGINTDFVTTGRVGLGRERDFTVYGDAVNIASRMETNAPVNSIMIPLKTKNLVPDIFQFEGLGKIEVKGKSQPVEVYKVVGIAPRKVERWERSKLIQKPEYVGRDKELNEIEDLYKQTKSQIGKIDPDYKPTVIGLRSPAGLGKSRLIYEFIQRIKKKHKLNTLENIKISGYTKSYAQAPYTLWTSLIKNYVGINETDTKEIIRDKFENSYSQISNELTRNEKQNFEKAKPILGFILGLTYEDIRLEKPDLKSLQAEIFLVIRYFLEAITKIANKQKYPMIIILEDLHWIDESSLNAFKTILSSLNVEEKRSKKPSKIMFFLLAYRNEFKQILEFKYRTEFFEFQLQPLTTDNSDLMIKSMLGKISIPQKTKTELLKKSEGNPFYIEEWIHFLFDEDIISKKDDKWQIKKEISTVPDTLNKLILSRIDRMEDTLKTFLQKASVIGYSFLQSILEAIEKKLGNEQPIEQKLSELINLDWLKKEKEVNEADAQYLFKHILVCDVAYQTILFYNKKILHKIIAVFVEEKFKDNKEYYAFLANHYEKAEVTEKAIEYLEKAGDFAKENYQNELALNFFEKLLNLLPPEASERRIRNLHKKGTILFQIGKWNDAPGIFHSALNYSQEIRNKALIAKSNTYLGTLLREKGVYNEALVIYEKVLEILTTLDDKFGLSRILAHMGTVYWYQGNYDDAMKCFNGGLDIAKELNEQVYINRMYYNIGAIYRERGNYDKAMECFQKLLNTVEKLNYKLSIGEAVGRVGTVYWYQGNYDKAMECFQREFIIAEELGNKQGISFAVGNMGNVYSEQGNYEKAMECCEKYLKIGEELGDKRGTSEMIRTKGNVYSKQGNYEKAMECYAKTLKISEKLGDKVGISATVGNIGVVYDAQGDYNKAMEFYEKALSIANEVGTKWLLLNLFSGKAETLYNMGKYDEAIAANAECLKIAEELKDEEHIFNCKVLKVKIEFKTAKNYALRIKNCIIPLEKMLQETKEEEQIAELKYELAIMNDEIGRKKIAEEHKQKAISIFKKVYKKTPKIVYKSRIAKLEKL